MIHKLRNHGGEVMDRVARGERVTITRGGKPVADLRPCIASKLSAEALLARWAFGQVAASLRRSGPESTARAYDAIIAATALANGLPVYTCNPSDFSGIDGLEVVAVPHPDSPPLA